MGSDTDSLLLSSWPGLSLILGVDSLHIQMLKTIEESEEKIRRKLSTICATGTVEEK